MPLHLWGGNVKGRVVSGLIRTEDHELILRIHGASSVCGMSLGNGFGIAEVWWLCIVRSHHGGLFAKLDADGHHAEGDAKNRAGLHRESDELWATFWAEIHGRTGYRKRWETCGLHRYTMKVRKKKNPHAPADSMKIRMTDCG